eukprot:TRINITY_DN82560_c0_g1_i1.p1 TRINITY_DN82560_c0_g1~~TRINITY_DN82560_c0_g1_i1.p1  ORF type:complete len:322 (-),score=32.12 TRINITY_DN82560_c0_g1_i1:235-1200(-)
MHAHLDSGMTPLSTAAPSDSSASSSIPFPISPTRGLCPAPGTMLLAGVAQVAGLPVPAIDAFGAPFEYPKPLQVRHTFLEVVGQKTMPADDCRPKERRARSAPACGLDDPLLQWSPEKLLIAQAASRLDSERSESSQDADLDGVSLPRTPRSEDFPTFPGALAHSPLALPSCNSAPAQMWSDALRRDSWTRLQDSLEEPYIGTGGSSSSRASASWADTMPAVQRIDPGMVEEAAAADAFGMSFPSRGSMGHYERTCKPCAFLNTKGCENGFECQFCHLCEPGEKKRRRKEKMQMRHAVRHYSNAAYRGDMGYPPARWRNLA